MVAAEGGNFKVQLWRIIRVIAVAFPMISGVGALMEDKGISKGLSINEEVQPIMETRTKFSDVKGVDEAKAELEEIVRCLRNHKMILFPCGCILLVLAVNSQRVFYLLAHLTLEKSMLARAITGEAGVPFFSCSGSEFEEIYVGVGARRVRDLFSPAKKRSPCIIFIDEIDPIGGRRNSQDLTLMRMTLNQLLVELDGFNQNEGTIVIAATNYPESLDKALVRPGRFDCHVAVLNPDVEGRWQILEYYLSKELLDFVVLTLLTWLTLPLSRLKSMVLKLRDG